MTDYISRDDLLNAFSKAAENRFISPTTLYGIVLEFPAADAIEELVKENESLAADLADSNERRKKKRKPQWIPVAERLPEDDKYVLAYFFNKSPYIAWHNDKYWCTDDFSLDEKEEGSPKYWMPLPEPPKDGAE